LLCAHDALIDTHVWGVAVGVVRDCEGGDGIDACESAEDEEFVFWGDEVVSVGLGDCAADWLDGGLWVGVRIGLGVGLGIGGLLGVVVVVVVGGWDLLAEGLESGEALIFGVQGCEQAPEKASAAALFGHFACALLLGILCMVLRSVGRMEEE